MEALSSEANEIKEDIAALESRIKRFYNIAGQVSEWFEDREWLVSQFYRLLLDSNNKDSSSVRTDYLNKRDESRSFLHDLLELRVAVSEIDCEIDYLRNGQLAPLPDDSCASSEKNIVIKFGYSDEDSYSDISGNLIKGCDRTSGEALVLTCLKQNEPLLAPGDFSR